MYRYPSRQVVYDDFPAYSRVADDSLALDAADGVIDGRYYGAPIVRGPRAVEYAPDVSYGRMLPSTAGYDTAVAPAIDVVAGRIPKLFVTRVSANCLGPWLLLRESGIPFELVDVDVGKGETHTPAFLAMNPMGKVPTFADTDGTVIWESNAIMRYICMRYEVADKFFPASVQLRGRIEMALDWRQTVLYPNLAKVAYPFLGFSKDRSKIAEGKAALDKDLKVLMDFFLHETPFIGGATACIADYSVGLALLYVYATDFKTPARVKEYLENLAAQCPHWNEVTEALKNYMARS
eukprot:NODE_1060_length_1030_cov_117.228128_g1015_i0.p1 GENE.NODE_1060_length_1030_cov_117.228128_g1015_i0~~NODE_1060_length_1030_cov_117.228128_g1015_i0.p1  ORF type:complete len:317 (+),score=70.57 NODE_1060_length_1030_cov_117.228128_g1015_i0:73-951(+)